MISKLKPKINNSAKGRTILSSEAGTSISGKMIAGEVIPTGEDYEAQGDKTFNLIFGEDAEITYHLVNGDVISFPFLKNFILMADIVKVEATDKKLLAFI